MLKVMEEVKEFFQDLGGENFLKKDNEKFCVYNFNYNKSRIVIEYNKMTNNYSIQAEEIKENISTVDIFNKPCYADFLFFKGKIKNSSDIISRALVLLLEVEKNRKVRG